MPEEKKEEELVVEEEKKKGLLGKVKDAILQMLKNKQQLSQRLLELPFLPGREEY